MGMVLSLGCFHEQCNGHLAAFAGQNVVGATGGLGIHGFNADPLVYQRLYPGALREANLLATSEDHQFSLQVGELRKVCLAQFSKAGAIPIKTFTARPNDHAGDNFFGSDTDPVCPVATDGLNLDGVGVKLHDKNLIQDAAAHQ